jgi:hypothetical protein
MHTGAADRDDDSYRIAFGPRPNVFSAIRYSDGRLAFEHFHANTGRSYQANVAVNPGILSTEYVIGCTACRDGAKWGSPNRHV